MAKHKTYRIHTDIERIESLWRKLSGSFSHEEWSAVIVQAATVVEIAANLVIRKELQSGKKLDEAFVNQLVIWANGIVGKMDRLLLPLFTGKKQVAMLRRHKKIVEEINEKRNAITHRGKYCNKSEATIIINQARTVVESLVRIYLPKLTLKEKY